MTCPFLGPLAASFSDGSVAIKRCIQQGIVAKGISAVSSRLRGFALARNSRDWHILIEFCGLVGTIIVDEDEWLRSRRSQPLEVKIVDR